MISKTRATAWLGDLPNADALKSYEARWAQFSTHDNAVVTLFGSYDAGKSSLLRRILIDNDVLVPEWLTISARHETFENNEVALPDYVLRDSPGFAIGATDARGQSNTKQAAAAVATTDIGIAVLTPQLITSDKEAFAEIVAEHWPTGTLWFVISRFDEAGVDAEENPDAYRDRAGKKVAELRELLSLPPAVPVFVVAQDPFQEAGPDNDVSKILWDDFRDWDGMDALQAQLDTIAAPVPSDWRAAAERRFWTRAVADTLVSLRQDLSACRSNSKVAAQGVARRDSWEKELESLDSAALASLDGLVESVFNKWYSTGSARPTEELFPEIKLALTTWFDEHDAQLRRLQSTIQKTSTRDRSRPSWDGFESLVDQLAGPGAQKQTKAPADSPGAADHVEAVGQHVLGIMRVLAEQEAARAPRRATEQRASRAAKAAGGTSAAGYLGVAEAVLPLAIYIAKAVDDQRANAPATLTTSTTNAKQALIDGCTNEARDTWASFTAATRAMISDETEDQVALDASLRDSVDVLEAAIAAGEELIGG